MYYTRRKISWIKKLWKFRYRLYSIIFLLVLLPFWYSDSFGITPNAQTLGGRYKEVEENILATRLKTQKIVVEETEDIFQDFEVTSENGSIIFKNKNQVDIGTGSGSSIIDQNTGPADLDDIIPRPANPVAVNLLQYPKYNISAPIIYSTLSDLYKTDKDGNVLKDADGQFIPNDLKGVNSPIQLKLRDGVVHIVFSPQPGEYSGGISSYIVGHSSNYSFIKSDYNSVFKPLEYKSKPGEEFIIYDKYGRKLTFKVFEALKIAEADVAQAYKSFPGRRIVTLQTSILGWRDGRLEATHRWLTRGYLIDSDGKEIQA